MRIALLGDIALIGKNDTRKEIEWKKRFIYPKFYFIN